MSSYENAVYDRAGQPIMYADWLRLKGGRYDVVAKEEVLFEDGRKLVVSTIWLGWSAQSVAARAPISLFETAVWLDDEFESVIRWNTEAQARAGHRATVARYMQ
jgi:hypothetical protein